MEIFRLFGSIFVKDEASKALDKVSKKTDETSKKVQMSEKTFGKVSSGLNKVGSNMMKFVVAPLGTLGVGAIKASTDFKGGMAKVSTIADTTKVPINKLSEGALKLSKDFGVGATEITESMYQAISASVPTEKALGFVAVATKSAKGGFTDAATAVDGLSTVLNSYGMEADQADKIANQMLITQNKGKTTFGELASAVGKVTPISSQLNISTQELFSSLASTTAQGLATSESVTALKAAMSNIIKPSKEASEAAEQLGIDFSVSALKSKGWMGFLKDVKKGLADASPEFDRLSKQMSNNANKMLELEKAGKKNTTEYKNLNKAQKNLSKDLERMAQAADSPVSAMATMFGSVEGLNSILMMTSDNGMNIYNETMKEMKTNTHALDDAYKKMSEAPGEKFKKALNSMKVAAIQFGDVLAPAFEKVTNVISNFGNKLSNMTPQQKKFVVEIAKMAVGISTFVFAVGKIMSAIIFFKEFSTAIKGVSIAGKALTMGTVGWVAVIVAGVAMLVAFIISHWDQIKQVTYIVWNTIKTTIGTVLNVIKQVITTVFTDIKTVVTTIWNAIKTAITVVAMAIKFVVQTVFTLLVTIIRVPLEIIRALIMTVWNYIGGYITNVINGIKAVITTVWNAIASVTSSIWNAIRGVIVNVWNGIKGVIVPIINSIKQVITNVWNNIKAVTSSVFNAIRSVASSVWNGIKSVITSVLNGIRSVVTSVWNGIKSVTTSVWNGIKNAMLTPINAAKNTIQNVINTIKGFFSNLKLRFPKIQMPRLPHFKLNGSFSLAPPSVPKLAVDWYADGGILTQPTAFGMMNGRLQVGGEAGHEAILPISKLSGIMANTLRELGFDNKNNSLSEEKLSNIFANTMLKLGVAKPIILEMNNRIIGEAVAPIVSEKLGFNQKLNNLARGGAY